MRTCLRCGSTEFGQFCPVCGGLEYVVDATPATLLAPPSAPQSQPTPLRPRPMAPAMSPAPPLAPSGGGGRGDGAAKMILAITALLVVLGLIGFVIYRYLEPAREAMVGPSSSSTVAPPQTIVAPTAPSAQPPVTTQVVPAPSTVVSTVVVTAAPPAPTRPATSATGSAVRSLPAGSWITIFDSLPKDEFTLQQAEQRAAGMRSGSYTVSVIDSDAIPGLNGGYWALGVPGATSRDSAAAMCGVFGREVGGSCYPRQVE